MTSGAAAPSLLPVWSRHLLTARTPPVVTHPHEEFTDVPDIFTTSTPVPLVTPESIVHHSFSFGQSEILALRDRVPPRLRAASAFELVIASAWRSRVSALRLHPEQEVRILLIVAVRGKYQYQPPLPEGYYGNAFATPVAVTKAGKLCSSPLGYAVELVRTAKAKVDTEYVQSVADLMVLKGYPTYEKPYTYIVSDLRRAGLELLDFGWGKPVSYGVTTGCLGEMKTVVSFCPSSTNSKGVAEGISVPMSLPGSVMERVSTAISESITRGTGEDTGDRALILSSL